MHIDFHASERSSLGIEVELEIVDRSTRQLTSLATDILDAALIASGEGIQARAKHELMECILEINTDVCTTVAEARADLEATLATLAPHVEERGAALMCSGTHPFSHWVDQRISPDPRYDRLIEQMQWPARQLQIFGVHIHVGVRSAEKAIAIGNALSAYIPHFLALSASSPFWLGHDTGLASSRSKVFELLPTAGLPYQLHDWAEFETFMTTLQAAKSIDSIREVWWDIRPHPNFGTVEIRVCDGLPTLGEISAVAAIAQSLVEWLDGLYDRGFSLPLPRGWVVRENKWRAARHGLEAEIIVDDAGDLIGIRESIGDLVEELSPTAGRLDCLPELRSALTILETGPSYVRQREVARATRSLVRVVDSLIAELATDRVAAAPPTSLPSSLPSSLPLSLSSEKERGRERGQPPAEGGTGGPVLHLVRGSDPTEG